MFCWLQDQGKTNRIAILYDRFMQALLSHCIGCPVDFSELDNQQLNYEIIAVRIDPLFVLSGTSLDEFTNDRQLSCRKSAEHGEKMLEKLIDKNFVGSNEEKIVVFPETCQSRNPARWFMASCTNQSVGECLAESLSYSLSELKKKDVSTSLCIRDLLMLRDNVDEARVVRIFIRQNELRKFNNARLIYDS